MRVAGQMVHDDAAMCPDSAKGLSGARRRKSVCVDSGGRIRRAPGAWGLSFPFFAGHCPVPSIPLTPFSFLFSFFFFLLLFFCGRRAQSLCCASFGAVP